MPVMAILGHEWRGLWSSWLVRLWLVAAGLVAFLTVTTGWRQESTALLIAHLLLPYLIFPWFLVVIMLGISPVTGSRLDALADGILCRPVTRHEYLLASWAARVAMVLAVFLATMLPAVLMLTFATDRPGASDSVTWYGVAASLSVVALVLTFLVSLAFMAGTLLRKPLLAAAVLIFAWFPVTLVLNTFSLEEFSPVSLNQSLPTLLRTPWSSDELDASTAMSGEEMQEMAVGLTQFFGVLSGSAPVKEEPPRGFFEQGNYEDFSLLRVFLGYGVPAILAVGLALFSFAWRDL